MAVDRRLVRIIDSECDALQNVPRRTWEGIATGKSKAADLLTPLYALGSARTKNINCGGKCVGFVR